MIANYEVRLSEIHGLVAVKDLSVVVDSQADEMERLKSKLSEFTRLSEDWEQSRVEKNITIEELKCRLERCEDWKQEKLILQERSTLFEDEVTEQKKEFQEK